MSCQGFCHVAFAKNTSFKSFGVIAEALWASYSQLELVTR